MRGRSAGFAQHGRVAPRIPLPAPLDRRPFGISEGAEHGLGRGRLSGPDLAIPFRGVRSAIDADRAELFAPRLRRGDRFSHTTALRLWGAPLPHSEQSAVHVTSTAGSRHRVRGATGHESANPIFAIRSGLPVSTCVDAFIESASILALDDLVAVADYLVLDPRRLDPLDLRPYATRDDVLRHLAHSSGRGVRTARRALGLSRPGVESPRETALRLMLVRAGLPEPVCGWEVSHPSGRRVGWFDLAWPEWRVIAEYDGDQHRTSRLQYERDIRRFDEATELGWRVIRVRAHGIRTPAATADRVRTALVARGWSSRRHSRRLT